MTTIDESVIFSRVWKGEDGFEETSTVTLAVLPDGGLRLTGEDTGPGVDEAWGSDDHEYVLDLPCATVDALIGVLFEAAFNKEKALRIGTLRQHCVARDLPHDFEIW
jgi:hypothetical protein